jgi:hypothetical protein
MHVQAGCAHFFESAMSSLLIGLSAVIALDANFTSGEIDEFASLMSNAETFLIDARTGRRRKAGKTALNDGKREKIFGSGTLASQPKPGTFAPRRDHVSAKAEGDRALLGPWLCPEHSWLSAVLLWEALAGSFQNPTRHLAQP